MKRILKYLILLWPIPVLAWLIFITLSSQAVVDKKLSDANGMIWGKGNNRLTVNVTQTTVGEQQSYEILISGNNQNAPQKFEFKIDCDMWGGGFVKAVQADDDPELELIAWGTHESRDSFLLDPDDGRIKKSQFTNASKDIRNLTSQWHQAHVMNGMTLSIFIIFCIAYYLFAGIIWLTTRVIKRLRKKTI